jgi:hypothetical protein
LSQGRIPSAFLQGCGVPEALIGHFASQRAALDRPFFSCFLSYSHKDRVFAQRLSARLQEEHFRVWDAPENMQNWKSSDEMEHTLRTFDKWLLVLSKSNMNSEWVVAELRKGAQAGKPGARKLYPIRLVDKRTLKKWLAADAGKAAGLEAGTYPIADFSQWLDPDGFESAYVNLLKELRSSNGAKKK